MHKIIANLFSSILSFVHFVAALALALVIYAVFSGNTGMALNGGHPEQALIFAPAAIVGYVMVFGFISVILRMHENQELIAKSQEDIADRLAEISETLHNMPTQFAIMNEGRINDETLSSNSSRDRNAPPS